MQHQVAGERNMAVGPLVLFINVGEIKTKLKTEC